MIVLWTPTSTSLFFSTVKDAGAEPIKDAASKTIDHFGLTAPVPVPTAKGEDLLGVHPPSADLVVTNACC